MCCFIPYQVFSKLKILFLAYQSIGVIYGDLGTCIFVLFHHTSATPQQGMIVGTSPLYTFSGTFTSTPDREDVLGALSMIIWTLTLVVCVKYCGFVLSADDNGEGGTFALYSLLSRYVSFLLHTYLIAYLMYSFHHPTYIGQYHLE